MTGQGRLTSVLALLALAGCGGAQWRGVRLAAPNPLQSQRNFIVEPIHFERVGIGFLNEADYLAKKRAGSVQS